MKNSVRNFLISKINGFRDLEENFDSYNSDKISNESIETSIKILNELNNVEELFVFPMRDGGIQFEISRFSDIEEELIIDKEGNIRIIEYNTTGDLLSNKSIKLEQIQSFFI